MTRLKNRGFLLHLRNTNHQNTSQTLENEGLYKSTSADLNKNSEQAKEFKLHDMDALLIAADSALRTVFAHHHANRPTPTWAAETPTAAALTDSEKSKATALMRVNHVGEVCAQALYTAQALATRNDVLRKHLTTACNEETDHLAWCEQRLQALGGRTSLLNPLWYVGSFAIGYAAAKLGGDRMSLGFVVETERQVEAHLESHLGLLPINDGPSRAIVAQMKADEAQHAKEAMDAGAAELPAPFKTLMQVAAKVMTTVAHRI
jgi:ubiquinone biosynthesis monooxygenase Coq7